MSRRYLSLWLPDWPLQRMRLAARRVGQAFPEEPAPLALTAPERGVPRLTAVGQAAAALGLVPGMALADARAARGVVFVSPGGSRLPGGRMVGGGAGSTESLGLYDKDGFLRSTPPRGSPTI